MSITNVISVIACTVNPTANLPSIYLPSTQDRLLVHSRIRESTGQHLLPFHAVPATCTRPVTLSRNIQPRHDRLPHSTASDTAALLTAARTPLTAAGHLSRHILHRALGHPVPRARGFSLPSLQRVYTARGLLNLNITQPAQRPLRMDTGYHIMGLDHHPSSTTYS